MGKAHWLVSALALGLGLAAILLVTPKGSLAQPTSIDVVKTATKDSSAASASGGPVGSTFVINGENGTQVRPAVAYNS
jgi:hypothetical protein